MAETLGMTIEFRGKTTEFEQAVKTINGEIKETKSNLSLVNKELKLDPKNVENLTKKFELLKDKEKELENLTKTLKQGLATMDPNSKGWDEYNRALQRATVDLNTLKKELSTMPSPNLQVAQKTLEEYGKKLDDVGGKIEAVGSKLSYLSAGVVGLAIGGIKFNAELEQSQVAFTTLIGDAEKASEAISNIQMDAAASPFSTDALIKANQYLIATGEEADNSREIIMALGDAIAATGGGSNELERMAANLQQIRNLGKASSVDIKQFANAGIDVYGLLSDYTGKTVQELQKMDISYDVLTGALKSASSEGGKYFGAMENQSQTVSGSIATMKDSISQLLGELTKELMPVIKNVLSFLNDLIKRLKEMDPQTKGITQTVGIVIAALGPVVTFIGKLVTGFGHISTAISTLLKSEKIVAFFAKVSSSGGGLAGVLKTIVGALGGVGTAIAAVIAVLTTLYFTNENVRNAVNGLGSVLKGALATGLHLVMGLVEALGNIFNVLMDILSKVWDALKDSAVWNIFVDGITRAIEWIKTFVGWFSELIGWIARGVDWFNDLFRASNNAGDSINSVKMGNHGWTSSGFNSGGFMSGGTINVSNTFHVSNGTVSTAVLNGWADRITDRINENLGRMYA